MVVDLAVGPTAADTEAMTEHVDSDLLELGIVVLADTGSEFAGLGP